MNNTSSSSSYPYEVFQRTIIAGGVCAFVSTTLHPLDVIKIRLQNQSKINGSVQYTGMISGISRIYSEEGFKGITKGLFASILREISYSGVRIGAYEPIRGLFTGSSKDSKEMSPVAKFISAFLSGGIGAAIANPFDLMKTRFQSVLAHEPLPYPSTIQGIITVFKSEGIRGLYRGWSVTCTRAAVVTSAQLGSYDTIKNNILIKHFHMSDGFPLHFWSSMLAGIITATAANPVDVIKSRYMSDVHSKIYKSPIDCVIVSYKKEGWRVFFQGWSPAYWRLGPHTVMSFILIEKIRNIFGLGAI